MRSIALLALVVGLCLILGGCCSTRPIASPAPDRGTLRRQDARDPLTTPPMAGWPDGWVYERVSDEGVDGNGDPYRVTRGGFGATPDEARRNAR